LAGYKFFASQQGGFENDEERLEAARHISLLLDKYSEVSDLTAEEQCHVFEQIKKMLHEGDMDGVIVTGVPIPARQL
jgi:benzoyl-CoA reductase/2-hydroxyglutaryl-CoA dehydratase subunit BcrC/BadD/HgdB